MVTATNEVRVAETSGRESGALHLERIGANLTRLSDEQATYLSMSKGWSVQAGSLPLLRTCISCSDKRDRFLPVSFYMVNIMTTIQTQLQPGVLPPKTPEAPKNSEQRDNNWRP